MAGAEAEGFATQRGHDRGRQSERQPGRGRRREPETGGQWKRGNVHLGNVVNSNPALHPCIHPPSFQTSQITPTGCHFR